MKKVLVLCVLFVAILLPYNVNALEEEEEKPSVCECIYDEEGNLTELCDYHLEYGVDACELLCPQGGCW